MSYKILCFIVFVLFIIRPEIASSQGLSNDSLLFDEISVSNTNINTSDFTCRIVVTSSKNAIGDVWEEKKGQICGQEETFIERKLGVELKDFDKLIENSLVFVGADGYADIMIVVGEGNITFTKFRLGPNSSMMLPSLNEICDALKNKKKPEGEVKSQVKKGKLLVDIGRDVEKLYKDVSQLSYDLSKLNPIVYYAAQTIARHIKTKFTIEIAINGSDTVDIYKVYEGIVEVSLQNMIELYNDNDMGNKMEQLSEDLQSGKISMEEFQVKVVEYKNQMESQFSGMQPVKVEAGYKCIANKNSLKVEPIESDDDIWWDK